ncbi:hypothetical protein EBR43_00320 [bacterium]|nr:hypothetical protein [bacterium]NBX72322.1 hypothetical protein [bacterium]
MNRFLILFLPCLLFAGTVYYTDEPPISQNPEEFPTPLFDHPEFEPNYDIQEAYYFRDKKDLKKIVYKKESGYFEFNFGYSDLSVMSVEPYYYPQNYTQQIQTTNNNSGNNGNNNSNSSTTTQNLTVHETFSIIDYGTFDVTFPSVLNPPTYPDPTQQPVLQINAITRSKHLGYGFELSYNNNPTIELTNPVYKIFQTQTSTVQNTNPSNGGSQSSVSTTTVSEIDATVTLDKAKLKVVNVPIHLTLHYFPIYDGYFQPYLKAGLGLNLTHTVMDISQNVGSAATLVPLYQEGWAFMPFTYTYGGGVHIMITESLALSASYIKQRIQGRSTKFQVVLSSQNPQLTDSNGPFGNMRFKFDQKTTLKQIGLVYYF